MAGSRRFPPAERGRADDPAALPPVFAAVGAALGAHVLPGRRVAIALSGGRDSIALLDACAALRADRSRSLIAIHVHHGLSPSAGAWAEFCAARCAELGVPLVVRRISVVARPREGIEAAARAGRYAALADAAREAGCDAVLLAHHEDDQAETLLLQLARGAGPHGLRGMPVVDSDRGLLWIRPLLAVPRLAIEAHVAARDLRYVDDPSNDDAMHRRNAVRARIAPAIAQAFPGYPRTLARSAALQADAARLLDDLAALDADGAVDGATLERARLVALTEPRARNLLRWFLRRNDLRAPSAARLADMLRQLATAGHDREVSIAHDGRVLGIHRGRVVVHARAAASFEVLWLGEREIVLPHGRLAFELREGDGLALDRIERIPVLLRPRTGGERMRLREAGPSRSVKHLLQEASIPHWARAALPLVFCDGRLAAVPGVGIDVAWRAAPGSPGVVPTWRETPGEPRPGRR
jgi:tRNA(Ile)-lysidine synthase